MSAMSDYLEQALLDHVFNTVTFTPPATMYVGLFTTATTDAGGGTEVTGGAYARQQVYRNSVTNTPGWALAAVDAPGYVVDNADIITFPTATANWGNVTHVGVFDHVTTGNLLFHGALTATKTINSSDTASWAVGTMDLRME